MAWYGHGYGFWRPYVSVAQRRANAGREMERLRKKGMDIQPVKIAGRKIAHTFWGEAWCDHLEKFSDYENRLPRGRTYVRNGSVCHLAIHRGKIEAKVSGSELYTVKIDIAPLPAARWSSLKAACAGQVGSLLELLQGKLSSRVMEIVTDRDQGLFPSPKEITLSCSCPDWATMCKHVAAVMYGVGARLDEKPELLFVLRGVDHQELVSREAAREVVSRGSRARGRALDEAQLGEVFGIDLDQSAPGPESKTSHRGKTRAKAVAPSTEPPPARSRRSPQAKKAVKPQPSKAALPPSAASSAPAKPKKPPRGRNRGGPK